MARWTSTAWSFRRLLSRRSPCRRFWCYACRQRAPYRAGRHSSASHPILQDNFSYNRLLTPIAHVSGAPNSACGASNGIIGAVRRGGRVVDRTRLESGRTLTGTGSSNLPLSAIHPDRHFPIKQSQFQHAGSDGEGASVSIRQCPKVNRSSCLAGTITRVAPVGLPLYTRSPDNSTQSSNYGAFDRSRVSSFNDIRPFVGQAVCGKGSADAANGNKAGLRLSAESDVEQHLRQRDPVPAPRS